MMRSLDADYTYQDYHFKKRRGLSVDVGDAPRPALLGEPLEFQPERFSAENRKEQHRYVYFP